MEQDKAETTKLAKQAASGITADVQLLHNRAARSARLLCFLAKSGHKVAATLAADLAGSLVRSLNFLVLKNPSLFADAAAQRLNWPALVSVHRKLGDQHEKLIEQLQLGWVLKHVLSARSKWNPRLPANRIALSLLLHVARHRDAYQRLWHEAWCNAENQHSPALSLSDIRDLVSLVGKLKVGLEPVSHYLFQRLSAPTKTALGHYLAGRTVSEDLRRFVMEDLNKIIGGDSIFETERFRNVALSSAREQVHAQCSNLKRIACFNRLLIGDAFPTEITKQPPWLKMDLTPWIRNAGELEELSKDTSVIGRWWNVAKQAFTDTYPDPSRTGESLGRIETAFFEICGLPLMQPRRSSKTPAKSQ